MEKRCSKCGEVKQVEEFYKEKCRKDGYRCYCKSCTRIIARQYHDNNKKKERNRGKKYRDNNKEKLKKYQQQYCANNKEKVSNRKKQWSENNKGHIKQEGKQYRENNREHIKQYRENNRDKARLLRNHEVTVAADGYLLNLINGHGIIKLKKEDIPPEFIELKRTSLMLKREIKNKFQGEKNEQESKDRKESVDNSESTAIHVGHDA